MIENYYFAFYRIWGIEITENNNFNFHFHDAILLQGIDITNFFDIHNIFYNKESEILYNIDRDSCYLVIKSKINDNKKFISRSKEIVSFLSFLSFVNSNFKSCISLTEQVFTTHPDISFIVNNYDRNVSTTNMYSHGYNLKLSELRISSNSLNKILNSDLYINIYNIINSKKKSKYYKLNNLIKETLVFFYEHLNNINPSVIFMSSIISIEKLLKNESDKYFNIENRIKVLLGEKIFNYYNHIKFLKDETKTDLFSIRNEFVHRGKKIIGFYTYKSLLYFTLVFLEYVNFFVKNKELKSKDKLTKKLDIINEIENYPEINIDFKIQRTKYFNIIFYTLKVISFYKANNKDKGSDSKFNKNEVCKYVYITRRKHKINLIDLYNLIINISYNILTFNNFNNFLKYYKTQIKLLIKDYSNVNLKLNEVFSDYNLFLLQDYDLIPENDITSTPSE